MPQASGKKHWTQTAKGKRVLAARSLAIAAKKAEATASKNGIRNILDRGSAVGQLAESAEAFLLPTNGNGHVAKRSDSIRHVVIILARTQTGLERSRHEIKTWGELLDLVTTQYVGTNIEEIKIECNV
jgi:hypothetical protein